MRTMLLIIKKESKCHFTFVPRLLLLRLMLNSPDVKFLSRKGQPSDEVAFITDIMTENKLNKKLDGINVINTIKVTNY